MYKQDLELNNLQLLICHKTKLNLTKPRCDFMGLEADIVLGRFM